MSVRISLVTFAILGGSLFVFASLGTSQRFALGVSNIACMEKANSQGTQYILKGVNLISQGQKSEGIAYISKGLNLLRSNSSADNSNDCTANGQSGGNGSLNGVGGNGVTGGGGGGGGGSAIATCPGCPTAIAPGGKGGAGGSGG
jgi:hypothetical protein